MSSRRGMVPPAANRLNPRALSDLENTAETGDSRQEMMMQTQITKALADGPMTPPELHAVTGLSLEAIDHTLRALCQGGAVLKMGTKRTADYGRVPLYILRRR